MAEVGRVEGVLGVNASQWQRGLREAERSLQGFGQQVTRLGSGVDRTFQQSDAAVARFGSTLRTTLIPSAAALAGVLAVDRVVNFGQAILQAGINLQQLESRFIAVTGTAQAASQELGFVRETADRLGLSFQASASGFAGMAAAAQTTTLGLQGARDLFVAVSEASAAFGLSVHDTQGVLLAFQQVLSKGTLAAEEIRGQIGERLPGAFNIAAKAMGVTTEALSKMLEQGLVKAVDFLPRFAQELRNSAAVQQGLQSATQTTQAAINRLTNAWEALLAQLARSGPLQAAAAGMEALAAGLNKLNLPLGTFAQASAQAIDKVLADLDRQVGVLDQDMASLKARIDAATKFPEATTNIEGLTGTLKFLEERTQSLRAQMEALQKTKEQALTPPTFGATRQTLPPAGENLVTRIGGLSDAAIAVLKAHDTAMQRIDTLAQAMGSSFDAASARADQLRETIEDLTAVTTTKPGQTAAAVPADSPLVQRLTAELQAIERGIEAQQDADSAVKRSARERETELKRLTRERQEEIRRVFEETRTPIEQFATQLANLEQLALPPDIFSRAVGQLSQELTTADPGLQAFLQSLERAATVTESVRTPMEAFQARLRELESLRPHLSVETFGRAVGDAANELARATPEFQRWNELQEQGRQLTEQLRTPQEAFNDAVAELAALLQAGAISQETYNRGLQMTIERFDEAVARRSDLDRLFTSLTYTFASGFADAILQADKFGEALQNLAQDILELVIRWTIFQAITGAISGVQGLFSPTTASTGAAFTGPTSIFTAQHGGYFPNDALVQVHGPEWVLNPEQMAGLLSVGAGAGQTNVTVINNSGAPVQTQERENSTGGRDIRVVIGEMVAGEMSRSGSAVQRSLKANYGASQRLIRR